jgi:hypothetical protein
MWSKLADLKYMHMLAFAFWQESLNWHFCTQLCSGVWMCLSQADAGQQPFSETKPEAEGLARTSFISSHEISKYPLWFFTNQFP